jgi:hypothetical protein
LALLGLFLFCSELKNPSSMKSAHIFACPPKFTPILTAIMVAPYFPKFTPILTVIMGHHIFRLYPHSHRSQSRIHFGACRHHAPHTPLDLTLPPMCVSRTDLSPPLCGWRALFSLHIEVKRDRSPLAVLPMANDVVAGQCMVVGAVCEHTKTDCIFLQLRLLFMAEAQRTKATFFYPPASPHVWCFCREICVMCSS